MKKLAILLLILGAMFASLPKNVVSSENGYTYRYNECYKNPLHLPEGKYIDDKGNYNRGFICETDSKVCYLMDGRSPTLLYCESK